MQRILEDQSHVSAFGALIGARGQATDEEQS
jgi:hypothetical protein